jgi:tRNA threonylcarbamoyladenosine biosynthesis protein TsaB
MKLIIDTSSAEKIVLKLDGHVFETDAKNRKSQKLLPFLEDILSKSEMQFSDISEIQATPGPGSFTGLRVGVSVANALGYLLRVPVNGKRTDKGQFAEIQYE